MTRSYICRGCGETWAENPGSDHAVHAPTPHEGGVCGPSCPTQCGPVERDETKALEDLKAAACEAEEVLGPAGLDDLEREVYYEREREKASQILLSLEVERWKLFARRLEEERAALVMAKRRSELRLRAARDSVLRDFARFVYLLEGNHFPVDWSGDSTIGPLVEETKKKLASFGVRIPEWIRHCPGWKREPLGDS